LLQSMSQSLARRRAAQGLAKTMRIRKTGSVTLTLKSFV
jgi:hypothetical protein